MYGSWYVTVFGVLLIGALAIGLVSGGWGLIFGAIVAVVVGVVAFIAFVVGRTKRGTQTSDPRGAEPEGDGPGSDTAEPGAEATHPGASAGAR